jgi:hypothetical protein
VKKFLYTAVISIALGSCGGGDNPKPSPPVENKVPTTPILVAPINGKLCIDNSVNFQWNTSTDPDGDAITYQIQVAKNNQFSPITHTLTGSTTNQSISLEKGIAYYWRVKATDSKSLSSAYATVFNFYTEGIGESNHLPFSPELVKPVLNSIIKTTTATLEWSASDVDATDVLTFDVFFGTVNPPITKIGNKQTAKTLNVLNLVSSTNYYWKVVVKDNIGGEAIGQIWNFKTD